MPNPKRNTQIKNTAAIIAVSLLSPFSALFCEENICAALPIPAIPSPLGECMRIKTINNTDEMTWIVQTSVSKIYSPFLIKWARFEFNLILSKV